MRTILCVPMMLLLNPSNKKEITKLPTVKSNSPPTQ